MMAVSVNEQGEGAWGVALTMSHACEVYFSPADQTLEVWQPSYACVQPGELPFYLAALSDQICSFHRDHIVY